MDEAEKIIIELKQIMNNSVAARQQKLSSIIQLGVLDIFDQDERLDKVFDLAIHAEDDRFSKADREEYWLNLQAAIQKL